MGANELLKARRNIISLTDDIYLKCRELEALHSDEKDESRMADAGWAIDVLCDIKKALGYICKNTDTLAIEAAELWTKEEGSKPSYDDPFVEDGFPYQKDTPTGNKYSV